MNRPLWVHQLAEEFWALAGPPPAYPRDLADLLPLVLPLTVVPLPGLTLEGMAAWLQRAGVAWQLPRLDRRLRGGLAARRDYGFLFVDAADEAAERRFTVAHELAHFLRDFRRPRSQAVARLGPGIRAVLDGERPPTTGERVQALLRRADLAPVTHLLARTDPGTEGVVTEAERAADRLTWELLAPAEAVLACGGDLVAELERHFGLPAAQAAAYAAELTPAPRASRLVLRLRFAQGESDDGRE